jgi:probable HAF family extracellular repeat protein
MKPTDIDRFNATLSTAAAINSKDEVAGSFFPADGSGHAYFWSKRNWSDVGNLGGTYTFAFGINDSDLVVGQSDITTIPDPIFGIPPFHAFAWQAGTLTDFGPLFNSNFSYAYQVDPAGNVVGTSDVANDTAAHGFIWNQGVVTDLGTLPGDQVSWAIAENNVGAAVGSSGFVDPFQGDGPPVYAMQCPCKAVLWQNGQIIDLNTAVPKQWQISLAFAISDNGEIVAEATLPKVERVLLKPAANGTYSVSEDETQLPSSSASPRMLRRDAQGNITHVW